MQIYRQFASFTGKDNQWLIFFSFSFRFQWKTLAHLNHNAAFTWETFNNLLHALDCICEFHLAFALLYFFFIFVLTSPHFKTSIEFSSMRFSLTSEWHTIYIFTKKNYCKSTIENWFPLVRKFISSYYVTSLRVGARERWVLEYQNRLLWVLKKDWSRNLSKSIANHTAVCGRCWLFCLLGESNCCFVSRAPHKMKERMNEWLKS